MGKRDFVGDIGMNKQKAPRGIEWTRIKADDGVLDGYTWNPVGGCKHGCEWTMPDGSQAVCYAKTIAERVAMGAYPHGFEHHYWNPERLNEPLKMKKPAGIFMDSMSDLMGHWVDEGQIKRVLGICESADWHTFQMLTKNAPRLLKFVFPENVWVGVSSPPDVMFGKALNRNQQGQMLMRSLSVLRQVNVPVRWMSFEPLSWDVSTIVGDFPDVLNWAVIGAASNGRNEYPPNEADLKALIQVLDDQGVPVFFKGNLRSLNWARDNWREDFPARKAQPEQMGLL